MKRDYTTGVSNNIKYFVGDEVENTLVKGQKTLFVAIPNPDLFDILHIADKNECTHIYMGANKVFGNGMYISWKNTLTIIEQLLVSYEVTLDIPVSKWEDFVSQSDYYCKDLKSNEKFHINLSVEIPCIDYIKNLNIKLDDIGFNTTNPGVWVINHKDIERMPHTFNDWSVYKSDKICD